MKYYLEPLVACISRVSREVFLQYFEMNQDELSQIVKAARNSQRLILQYLKIQKSGTIDFGNDLSYKTQLISFQCTGSGGSYSNWSSNRDQFDAIVQEIKNSSLSKSLQVLGIYNCSVEPSSVDLLNISIDTTCYNPLQY